MVVHEVPFPREPYDAQQARHRALARRQNGPDQQHLGATSNPLEKGGAKLRITVAKRVGRQSMVASLGGDASS